MVSFNRGRFAILPLVVCTECRVYPCLRFGIFYAVIKVVYQRMFAALMQLQQEASVVGLGNDIAVQAEGVGFVRGQPVTDHAEINGVFRVAEKSSACCTHSKTRWICIWSM